MYGTSIDFLRRHCSLLLIDSAAKLERGFTYIELMVSVVILVGGILGTMAAIAASVDITQTTRDEMITINAARQMIEGMQDQYDFSSIYGAYNSNSADDPFGAGTAPGPNFAIPRLSVQPGDADGMAGEIIFPEIAGQLREDTNDPLLGMPMDMGPPAGVDTNDHSGDYVLLPVMIRVSWSDGGRNNTYTLRTVLSDR